MEQLINIHTHRNSGKAFTLVNKFIRDLDYNEEFDYPVSIGLHPWHIAGMDVNRELDKMDSLCNNTKVIATGECGIDRSISVSIEKQTEIFLLQNEIAIAHDLPVIIHSVRSYSDFLALLKKGYNKTPWIFHGFSGNFQIARRLVDFGAYISLGSSLLKDFSKTNETMKKTTLQRIFLETDESDAGIEDIYKKAAALTGIELNEFINQIYQNFIYCFNYGIR